MRITSICLKVQFFSNFPRGTIPPLAILFVWSGMILFRSTSDFLPSPLQEEHAPCGELNENILGSGSGNEKPLLGHISHLLKCLVSPLVFIIDISPFPFLRPLEIALDNLFSDFLETCILSMINEMSWILYLSNLNP